MTEPTLIIDDDATFNAVLVRTLERRGHPARGAADPVAALTVANEFRPARVVLNAACRIVVLTGYASIATAVDAIKLGAVQYLAKPVEIEAILAAFESDDGPDLELAAPDEPLSIDRLEWEHIQRVLNENDGNISATARALKMHRRTLQRKLGKHPVRT